MGRLRRVTLFCLFDLSTSVLVLLCFRVGDEIVAINIVNSVAEFVPAVSGSCATQVPPRVRPAECALCASVTQTG